MEDFIITRDKMGERRTPIQYKGIDQTEALQDLENLEKEVESTPKRKTFKQRLKEEKEKQSDEPTA